MRIQTLENTDISVILEAFNLSFSDYLVPLSNTKEQFEHKIIAENIQLTMSAGAFEGNSLVGFILHGCSESPGDKVIYNAGTGVIPTRRGSKITRQLYDFLLPLFYANDISRIQLEVITENHKALAIYKDIGFGVRRTLQCFKGVISITLPGAVEIRVLSSLDWPLLQSFWDFAPAWANSPMAIENCNTSIISIGAYKDTNLIGYVLFNPLTSRILQFAVTSACRRNDVGTALFNYIRLTYGAAISIINVDKNSSSTLSFLDAMGLVCYVEQYEISILQI